MNWNRITGPRRGPTADPIQTLRRALFQRYAGAVAAVRREVGRLLAEAEAEARTTPFPELIFPLLAEEKLLALSAGRGRPLWLRPQSEEIAFGA